MDAESRKLYQKRIDYIMASPNFQKKCTYAEVVNYDAPEKLSDHFPVIAVFELWD